MPTRESGNAKTGTEQKEQRDVNVQDFTSLI
jgi:hypothetical protein